MIRFRTHSLGRYGRRYRPGEMNRTEAAYAECLEGRKLAGEIVGWWFEPLRFVLAEKCQFTPDFGVLFPSGEMEFVDVKGGGPIADDAMVKIKAAAEKFFMFRFVQEKQRPKKAGGGFERREF